MSPHALRWHWPLCVLLCTAPLGARAQAQAEPTHPSEEAGKTGSGSESVSGSGSESVSGSESEPEPVPEDLGVDEAELAASHATLAQRRVSELQTALRVVQREREDSSLLLPWLVLSAGIAMSAVGVGIGMSDVLCDGSCTGPFVSSWLVVAGATAGSAGGLWLALEQHDQAELRRRHESLERELEYLKWSAAVPGAGSRAGVARAAISLRHAF